MKEFEYNLTEALSKGLRRFETNPRNELSLVECHNLMPTEAGLEPHERITSLNADGISWGGQGKLS